MIVYGALYNQCVHESSAHLLSLHFKKKNAWKVILKHKWNETIDRRESALRYGKLGAHQRLQDWEWWGVKEYEVQD